MENEWWKNDLDGEQDADAPKSLRIPKTTNYTLAGGVNELPNPGTNDVWGQASPEQKSIVPKVAWFFFGAIGRIASFECFAFGGWEFNPGSSLKSDMDSHG